MASKNWAGKGRVQGLWTLKECYIRVTRLDTAREGHLVQCPALALAFQVLQGNSAEGVIPTVDRQL